MILPTLRDLREEFLPMLRLATPVVLAELGWMTMGIVDTVMVGRLGAEAIGAVGVGKSLLMVAALFQLFDGVQTVATGVLRGLGDTRTPMVLTLAGHWFVGLPLAYLLCFPVGMGVVGLWWGLSSGLIICGLGLLLAWSTRIQAAFALLPRRAWRD